ncbi:MAG: formyl transferase, partial [Deltaproteobacteria bacterium]|nr:formyl transferase [Deltaproteobacteria bacterium]
MTPIFDPDQQGRPMRVAAFMSGSGTNIMRLLEYEKRLKAQDGRSPFETVFIFSDRSDGGSAGERIALENGLPYFSYDIRAYHAGKSIKRTVLSAEGLAARRDYDRLAATLVEAFHIDVIALGGYMSYTTLGRCVNVHPADLSLLDDDGNRKYVGDRAVHDAIAAGEMELRASTLWTDAGVDTGPLLMVSNPVSVGLPEPLEDLLKDRERFDRIADSHQEQLKEAGDWKIFPRTIELIARGHFAFDPKGRVLLDGSPVPGG